MDITAIYVYALTFIIGLCIGSFLNVVILRSLSNESIAFPASKCPKCQTPLKWWHNIPVISYIFLRGKCAFCKEPISIQYPIIELLTALMFVGAVWKFGLNINGIFAIITGCLFIVIAGTDWKEKVVFDVHCIALIAFGLLYALGFTVYELIQDYSLLGTLDISKEFLLQTPLTLSIFGAFIGFAVMKFVEIFGKILAGTDAFGNGDSYITTGLGAIFGWKSFLGIFVLSVLLTVAVSLPVMIVKSIKNKNYKPVISLFALVLALGLFEYVTTKYNPEMPILICLFAVLCLTALYFVICMLKDIRTNPQNQTYLPYGPALIIAGFVFMFGFVG